MTDPAEIRANFWKCLRSDRSVMLGLADGRIAPRPMTVMTEDDADHGPLWIFTSTETELGSPFAASEQAVFTFASKGHDIFATVHGLLTPEGDRDMVDQLWNAHIAAWYPGGKEDPKLLLLRFDPAQAEIWLNGSGLLAGLKTLFGGNPKRDYANHVTKGPLD